MHRIFAFVIALVVVACSAEDPGMLTRGHGARVYGDTTSTGHDGEGEPGDVPMTPVDDTPDPAPPASPSPPKSSTPTPVTTKMETTATLNLRSGPSTSHAVLLVMPSGSVVDVVNPAAQTGFLNVRFLGTTGWASTKYLEAPSATTTPAPAPGGGGTVDIDGPPVRPHVQVFADAACNQVAACRASTYDGHDPSADLALDLPISAAYGQLPTDGNLFGDRLAAFAVDHMAQYRIEYVIFRQRINLGSGWTAMADRGSITQNHFDHVHVSFLP